MAANWRNNLVVLTLFIALSALLSTATQAQSFKASHPMDALTPGEVVQAVNLLKAARHVNKSTQYPMVTLFEAPKKEILAWKEGDAFTRKAFVIARRDNKTFESVIDLTGNSVISFKEIPGAEPAILQTEWNLARDLTFADPRWRAAMKRRGITSDKGILCTPVSAGFFESDPNAGRRLLKVPCYDGRDNLYPSIAREIEGVIAVVDTNAGKVVQVIDTGEIVSTTKKVKNYGKNTQVLEPKLLPVVQDSPLGTNIKIKGAVQVEWRNWSFHIRADRRVGMIMSLIRFKDGDKKRLIAYQMNISEMFVPYMDPDPTWNFRTYMDAGEFGLGYLVSSLKPGVDCPEKAFFVDLLFPSDQGGVFKAPRALCIFERSVGDPAFRHWNVSNKTVDGVPEIELVVRMAPTIGNYDYLTDYIFQSRGNINVRVGASGFVAVKSVKSKDMESATAKKDTRYGRMVAPYTVAPYHDHHINYRIDLDIDGPNNTFVRDFVTRIKLPKSNFRRSIWNIETRTQKTESAITDMKVSKFGGAWRVENTNRKTPILKNNPSYQLMPWHTSPSIMLPEDPAQARAQFTRSPLWMTKFKPRELWAAGDYPNLSQKDTGLPVFVKDKENIVNKDIVLWYNASFHHITRPEDFSIMPTMWFGFTLRPVKFFDQNKASLQNPEFAK